MNHQLTRVQIYLEKEDLSLLDQVASKIKVTRSQIIREASKAVAEKFIRTLEVLEEGKSKTSPLMELIGIETSRTGRLGLDVDEIYTRD